MTFQTQLDTLQASIENIESQLITMQSYLTATGSNVVVVLTSGSSWTVPASVTSVYVEGVGGGEGGSTSANGQGGGYARGGFTVTPGATIAYSVGMGGAASSTSSNNAGGDTWFNSTSVLCAIGGASSGTFAPGGGYHQTSGQGAAGPVWSLNSSRDADNGFGGRGGADASSTVPATPGGPGSEWGPGIGCGGGGGGNGYSGAGADGGIYGGGGGSGVTTGGNGAQGVLVITFTRV